MSQGNSWYSLTAASRDYGLTSGTRDSPPISLTELGREIVYAADPTTELNLKKQAFLNIDIFKRVLEYYKGSNLPDMQYLGNVLTKQFGLPAELHDEFAKIFRENCRYLEIVSGPLPQSEESNGDEFKSLTPDTVTLSEGTSGTTLTAFVILPFLERDPKHAKGVFPGSASHTHHSGGKGIQDRKPPGERHDPIHHRERSHRGRFGHRRSYRAQPERDV